MPESFNATLKQIKVEADEETKRASLLLSNMTEAQRNDALGKLPSSQLSALTSSGQFNHRPIKPELQQDGGSAPQIQQRSSLTSSEGTQPSQRDSAKAIDRKEAEAGEERRNGLPLGASLPVPGLAIVLFKLKLSKGT